MEQRVGAVPGPSGFVGMPTEEFAFEHFSEHAAKYIVRFAVIVDLRDQLCGLLAVHIRHEARIIQPCCPIEKGLLRTHDKQLDSTWEAFGPDAACDRSNVPYKGSAGAGTDLLGGQESCRSAPLPTTCR